MDLFTQDELEGTVKWNEIGRHPTKKFVYVQKGLQFN